MTMQGTRILGLAAATALALASPAWAATTISQGAAPVAPYTVENGVTSNRLTTARMWTQLQDNVNALRAEVAAENWVDALNQVRLVRTRIDMLQSSKFVDHNARLIVAELRPSVLELEERLTQRRTRGMLRSVDAFAANVYRAQSELLAEGHMERLGGGAGGWRAPRQPPSIEIVPPPATEPVPPTDENVEETDPNRDLAPGNERNQIDEWRGPID